MHHRPVYADIMNLSSFSWSLVCLKHMLRVRALTGQGALAERNTFQGERCIYNALNDRIRNLLLQYDFSKSSDPYVYWSTHISGLLTRTTPQTSDIALTSDEQQRSFHLHKFLLASRTPYFRKKLEAQPETTTWNLAAVVPIEAIHIALRYIYLGDVPRDIAPAGSSVSEDDVAKGLDKISKQLGIEHLWEAILAGSDRRLARQRYQDEEERALKQLGNFFNANVLGHKMVVDADRVADIKWHFDNPAFADVLLRADIPPDGDDDEDETAQAPVLNGQGIPIGTANGTGDARPRKAALYPVHKAMLIRSEYFDKMFSGDFVESRRTDHLRVVTMDCSPAVLELVLSFLYTESAVCPLEHALDLLYTADMLFLDSLKSKAAQAISTLGSATTSVLVGRTHAANNASADNGKKTPVVVEMESINIYDVIHAAWDLRVQRLEEFGARYLATRLEDYIDDPDFQELIRESADRIISREETDTIELLDDIRYYLSERFRLRFEDAGIEDMMLEDEAGEAAQAPGGLESDNATVEETADEGEGVRTLNGEAAEDEFVSDAINYQILLGKIDAMLERLNLDA